MKKNYITLSLLFSFIFSATLAQTVSIPDPNFEQALIDQGIDSDGVINQSVLYSDILPVSDLDVSNRNISDLTGIDSFFNLLYLDCSNNNISNLTSVDAPDLRTLILRGNKFSTLTIDWGDFSYRLSHVDVSDNPNLTYLYLGNFSSVYRISMLNASNNPALKTIICADNGLEEINLSGCLALEELNLAITKLNAIDLTSNINLKILNLANNNLSVLDLSNQSKLTTLNVSGNKSLKDLDCSNNEITSLSVTSMSLNTLNCSNNQISKFYEYFDFDTSSIKSLNLSNNLLESFYLEHASSLTSLDISNNPLAHLEIIDADNLTGIDTSNLFNLNGLVLQNTPLADLDLSNNSALGELTLTNTNLTTLDLTEKSSLTNMGIQNNTSLTCVFVDNAAAANDGQAQYASWYKDNDEILYRTESCDFDIVLSTNQTELLENGEQAIITATLNEVNPNEDVIVNLTVSGSAEATNFTLSSNTIIIPSGQLSASTTLTANEDDMDSDKTVIIDVESVENADELTTQQLTFTINHINSSPTDISLSNPTIDENSIIGTEIGLFTTIDVDDEDLFTYTLVAGDGDHDNGSFTITDNQLLAGEVFDYETENSYSIRVQTDDGNGEVFSKSFIISINDLNFLKIKDSNASLRYKNDIILNLESTEIIKGFQFDVTFPDGFVFNPSDLTNSGLPENFQISSSNVGGNTYRVIGFSLSNETIAPGLTPIITLPTFINISTPPGEYSIPVFNVNMSDVNNQDIASLSPIDGVVTVYEYPRGDANGDNKVNVLDILDTIDYIFGNPPSIFNFELVDINSDDTINVLDVLGIQDIILNPIATTSDNAGKTTASKKTAAGENYLNITNDNFAPGANETIEINLINQDVVKGLEFDFVLPEGFTFNPADITGTSRLDGLIINAREISQNTYKILIFSFSSSTVAAGTEAILSLPVFIENNIKADIYPIELTSVIISDTNNTNISTQAPDTGKISIITLGVDNKEVIKNEINIYPNPVNSILNIDSGITGDYQLYDINGRNVGKGNLTLGHNEINISFLQNGLYIVSITNNEGSLIKKIIKN